MREHDARGVLHPARTSPEPARFRKEPDNPGPRLCSEAAERHAIHLDEFARCEFNGDGPSVHVISRKRLLDAAEKHGDLSEPLDIWYRIAKKAEWKNLMDVRRVFPTADAVGKFTVFNIKGNAYRLITEIRYQTGRIFLRHVLTHAEYDKGGWKQ